MKYMMQPPGFIVERQSTKVCKLIKSIYGLKRSPRAWSEKFSNILTAIGFTRTTSDYSLFVRRTSRSCVILIVYVDDIIITGSDVEGIAEIKQYLQSKLRIKDLERLQYFLGIEVLKNDEGMHLCQKKYVLAMLNEVGMLKAESAEIPLETSLKLEPTDGELLQDSTRYRRLMG